MGERARTHRIDEPLLGDGLGLRVDELEEGVRGGVARGVLEARVAEHGDEEAADGLGVRREDGRAAVDEVGERRERVADRLLLQRREALLRDGHHRGQHALEGRQRLAVLDGAQQRAERAQRGAAHARRARIRQRRADEVAQRDGEAGDARPERLDELLRQRHAELARLLGRVHRRRAQARAELGPGAQRQQHLAERHDERHDGLARAARRLGAEARQQRRAQRHARRRVQTVPQRHQLRPQQHARQLAHQRVRRLLQQRQQDGRRRLLAQQHLQERLGRLQARIVRAAQRQHRILRGRQQRRVHGAARLTRAAARNTNNAVLLPRGAPRGN